MTQKVVTNLAASVHARLLKVRHAANVDFQRTLHRYAAERFLFRLGESELKDKLILKGAMLFILWSGETARPTKDLDFAGYLPEDPSVIQAAIREIVSTRVAPDGLEFHLSTLVVSPIRDDEEYHGFRVNMRVTLDRARIPFQIDIGFGDVISPSPVEVTYPAVLGENPPHVRAYPREAVIAEKLHAMVKHGTANSRYKDFYDVDALSRQFAFEGATVCDAIRATFSRRKSADLSSSPPALTASFYDDANRENHWKRFLARLRLDPSQSFVSIGESVVAFLASPVYAIRSNEPFPMHWPPGGPWQ